MLPHVKLAEEDDLPDKREKNQGIPLYHKVLLNRTLKVCLTLFVLAGIVPWLIFFLLQDSRSNEGLSSGTCAHTSLHRIQCGYTDISRDNCLKVNCCYDHENMFCYQMMPSKYSYLWTGNSMESIIKPRKGSLKVEKQNLNEVILKPRQVNSPYLTKQRERLSLVIKDWSSSHVEIALYDTDKVNEIPESERNPDMMFDYYVFYSEFFFEIYSHDDNITQPLFSTARGPLIATLDGFWEWSFYVTDEELYGMGDLIMETGVPKVFYNRDDQPSSIPFFMAQRNGSYHGIYIEHQGPMEFVVLESKVISIKVFGGDSLRVHFFYGENPAQVLKQFTQYQYTGSQNIPPYWALGAHFCRSNISNFDISVANQNTSIFLENAAGLLPYDSDCIIDELFQFVNSIRNMSEFYDVLESILDQNKRFLPSLRPHMLFNRTEEYDISGIAILNSTGDGYFTGLLYNSTVVYPDYSMEATMSEDFWINIIDAFNLTSTFILKDNWPKNENVTNEEICWVDSKYATKIMNATLCQSIPWNSRIGNSSHLISHNLYGSNFVSAVQELIRKKEKVDPSYIVSASNTMGSKVGSHMQNIITSWDSMRVAFKRVVSDSMSGVYMQSVPVCGDSQNFTAESLERLCLRWYFASVAMPMFYVLSNSVERHPFSFPGFARDNMIEAVKMRYRLLPYYYTILNRNEPLLRSMIYEFYEDKIAMVLEEQYMVGDAIMIAPSFERIMSSVQVYFPNHTTWYDLWGGVKIPQSETGWLEVPSMDHSIPLFLRGGFTIAVQMTCNDTAEKTRLNNKYTLIIGLHCTNESGCISEGSLFLGEDIGPKAYVEESTSVFQFSANETGFNITLLGRNPFTCTGCNNTSSNYIGSIRVYGLNVTDGFTNYHSEAVEIDLTNITDTIEYPFNFDDETTEESTTVENTTTDEITTTITTTEESTTVENTTTDEITTTITTTEESTTVENTTTDEITTTITTTVH